MIARAAAVVVAVAAVLTAAPARAHEVVHTGERGRAIALRVQYADGEPLAYVAFEVWSPADPAIPHVKGRTDRSGWLAFVPDRTGAWRVKVHDESGHGLDTTVAVDDLGGGAAPAAGSAPSALGFALRPLVGLAAIAAVFAAVFALQRRKGRSP